jgi:hypothetical protein
MWTALVQAVDAGAPVAQALPAAPPTASADLSPWATALLTGAFFAAILSGALTVVGWFVQRRIARGLAREQADRTATLAKEQADRTEALQKQLHESAAKQSAALEQLRSTLSLDSRLAATAAEKRALVAAEALVAALDHIEAAARAHSDAVWAIQMEVQNADLSTPGSRKDILNKLVAALERLRSREDTLHQARIQAEAHLPTAVSERLEQLVYRVRGRLDEIEWRAGSAEDSGGQVSLDELKQVFETLAEWNSEKDRADIRTLLHPFAQLAPNAHPTSAGEKATT